MKSIEWNGSEVIILDQTKLPTSVEYVRCTDWRQVAEAIKCFVFVGPLRSVYPLPMD